MKVSCFFLFGFVLFASFFTPHPGLSAVVGNASPEKSREVTMPPPLLLHPEEITEFRDESEIEFSWREDASAAGYHVVLSKDRRFKRIVYENERVAGTSHTIDNLDYGTYFFKICSVARDGTEGPYSDTLTFIIVPHPSIIEQPEQPGQASEKKNAGL